MSLAFLGLNKVFDNVIKKNSTNNENTSLPNIYDEKFLNQKISNFSIIKKCSNSMLKPYNIDNQSILLEKFIYSQPEGIFTFVEKRKNNQYYSHIINFFSIEHNQNYKIFLQKTNNKFFITQQKINQNSLSAEDFIISLSLTNFYNCLENLNKNLINVELIYEQEKINKLKKKKNKTTL